MKIEKLGSNKIKVTVTPSELNVWDINPQSITPDSPQLREFIASLLAQSAEETGFDLASCQHFGRGAPTGKRLCFRNHTYGVRGYPARTDARNHPQKTLKRAVPRKKQRRARALLLPLSLAAGVRRVLARRGRTRFARGCALPRGRRLLPRYQTRAEGLRPRVRTRVRIRRAGRRCRLRRLFGRTRKFDCKTRYV